MELPSEVRDERQAMTQWSDRVGYIGGPSPAIGAPWQPPFTVARSVLDDTDDLGHLLRLLRDDPCGPRWAVVRPCEYHSCPCRSSISKLNDQLYRVARYEVAVEDFRRKFLSMPCHMLQNDSSCNKNIGKKRKFSSSQ